MCKEGHNLWLRTWFLCVLGYYYRFLNICVIIIPKQILTFVKYIIFLPHWSEQGNQVHLKVVAEACISTKELVPRGVLLISTEWTRELWIWHLTAASFEILRPMGNELCFILHNIRMSFHLGHHYLQKLFEKEIFLSK